MESPASSLIVFIVWALIDVDVTHVDDGNDKKLS